MVMSLIREPELLPQDEIDRFAGKWVAIKDGHVIFSGDTAQAIADWITKNAASVDLVRELPTEGEPEVWILAS